MQPLLKYGLMFGKRTVAVDGETYTHLTLSSKAVPQDQVKKKFPYAPPLTDKQQEMLKKTPLHTTCDLVPGVYITPIIQKDRVRVTIVS